LKIDAWSGCARVGVSVRASVMFSPSGSQPQFSVGFGDKCRPSRRERARDVWKFRIDGSCAVREWERHRHRGQGGTDDRPGARRARRIRLRLLIVRRAERALGGQRDGGSSGVACQVIVRAAPPAQQTQRQASRAELPGGGPSSLEPVRRAPMRERQEGTAEDDRQACPFFRQAGQ
jgi:hypothetical protein